MAGIGFLVGMLLLCAFAAAIGLVEARQRKRNAAGWIVSIVASIAGSIGGGMAVGAAMDSTGAFKDAGPDGIVSVLMLGGVVLGAWLALLLVNRFRD